jgi:prepilin-type N-terminal cleavage/methylation domain-containing protein
MTVPVGSLIKSCKRGVLAAYTLRLHKGISSSLALYGLRLRNSGFTLLETLLVSSIILVLITLSTPVFKRTYEGLKATACAQDIVRVINFSRERAIFEKTKYKVALDFEHNTYQILAYDDDAEGYRPLKDRWKTVFKAPDGVKIQADSGYIEFLPSGVSNSVFIDVAGKDGKAYSIMLNGSTGKTKIHEKTE